MITVNIIKQNGNICGFDINGHAEFADPGQDIICAAVSVLAINTTNSIEQLAGQVPVIDEDEENGGHLLVLVNEPNEKSILLLNSFLLGIESIADEYGDQFVTLLV